MSVSRKVLSVGLVIVGVGVVVWRGLAGVMEGVTEMERNMGGGRQVVESEQTNEKEA